MPATKLLNLFALSSLAILACSFGASPVNALSIESLHHGRSPVHAHNALAKKKRGTKRCRNREHNTGNNNPDNSNPGNTNPDNTNPGNTNPGSNVPAPPTPEPAPPPPSPPAPNPAPPPPPPSSPPPSNGNSAKVGLAWPINDDNALAHFKTNKVSPIYTWSPWIPSAARSLGYEGIPMLWGEKQVDEFARLVVEGYATTVLGFNEPDQGGQSNMSPQRGAQLWKQYIQPLKYKGYRLISPACTNAPAGKIWMQEFFAACDGCSFDGVATHYYGTSSQGFIDHITDYHNTFNLPVWPTEFACQNFGGGAQCNRDEVFNFMQTVKNFMDNTWWVAHYFAFGAMYDMYNVNPLNQLLGGNGYPTDLGYLYIN